MLRRSRCAAHWRPFLAPSLVRREPSVWVSVSGPSMPSSHARFGLAVSNPALTSGTTQAFWCCMQALLRDGHDATFRNSYAPLPYCRVSQFLAASFARNRRFRGSLKFGTFGWMRERGARWRLLRVLSEYSLSLTVTQTIVDPRSEPAVLFSGTGWVLGYPRGAHPRTPAPPCTGMA